MAAAGHGLHCLPVHHDPRGFVAEPLPGGGRTDRFHDVLAQYGWQRPAPDLQRGECQCVDAHIVVLVRRARRDALARAPLRRFTGRPISPLRLAPQRTFPVTHLTQHVIPGDLLVMRRREQIEQRDAGSARSARQRGDRSDGAIHRFVQVADHVSIPRETDDRGQDAFRNTMRHVNAIRIAPLGDDVSMPQDHAGWVATIPKRSHRSAEWFAAEGAVMVLFHAPRILAFTADRECDGGGQPDGIKSDLRRRAMFPRVTRIGEVDDRGCRCARRGPLGIRWQRDGERAAHRDGALQRRAHESGGTVSASAGTSAPSSAGRSPSSGPPARRRCSRSSRFASFFCLRSSSFRRFSKS